MKKIILIIVEGPSEQIALEGIFNKILASQNEGVVFELAYSKGGDILQSNTALDDLVITIKKHLNAKKLSFKDLKKVILISDLDGCYIPETHIIETTNAKIIYEDTSIICADKKHIKSRNANKKASIEKLIHLENILLNDVSVKFRFFFMSCNLDHVLYNKRNLDSKNKIRYAKRFALDHIDKESDFIAFIKQYKFDISETLIWDFVKRDFNSLSRCSNLYFLLKGDSNGNQ